MDDQATGKTQRGRIVNLLRYLLPLLLLGLAAHLLLPQVTSLKRAFQVLRQMAFWAVGLAVAMQISSYLGSGYLLRAIVTIVGQRLTVWRGTLVTTASYSFGLVAGGMIGSAAATYRWLRGGGVNAEGALLAGWLPGFFNTSALVIVSIFGLLHLLAVHQLATAQVIGFALMLFLLSLVVVLGIWGMQHQSVLTALAEKAAGRWARFRHRSFEPAQTRASMDRAFHAWSLLDQGGWKGPVLGALMNVAFDILTLFFVFWAAGHAVRPGVLLVGYGLPLLLGKVPFIPGGVGVVESTMAALYDGLGVPDPVTLVVILIYRLLSFWIPALVGFPLMAYMQRASRHSQA
jgi:uncharacterized protein (TIRG00374 family)